MVTYERVEKWLRHCYVVYERSLMGLTWSPQRREMKLTEQYGGPGPALSHRATRGLLLLNASGLRRLFAAGEGKKRNSLMFPCVHDISSDASPFAAMLQT